MAAELALRTNEFEQKVIQSDTPVLVDFWAEWCGPCRQIGPAVEEIAQELSGKAKVFKVNVDEDPELANRFGVMSIPALLVFKGGQVVDQQIGASPKAQIKGLLEKHI